MHCLNVCFFQLQIRGGFFGPADEEYTEEEEEEKQDEEEKKETVKEDVVIDPIMLVKVINMRGFQEGFIYIWLVFLFQYQHKI